MSFKQIQEFFRLSPQKPHCVGPTPLTWGLTNKGFWSEALEQATLKEASVGSWAETLFVQVLIPANPHDQSENVQNLYAVHIPQRIEIVTFILCIIGVLSQYHSL